eukprot:UN01059
MFFSNNNFVENFKYCLTRNDKKQKDETYVMIFRILFVGTSMHKCYMGVFFSDDQIFMLCVSKPVKG